jgi:hypothetical protein
MDILTNTLILVAPTIYCYGLYKLVELNYLKYLSLLFGALLPFEVISVLLYPSLLGTLVSVLMKIGAMLRIGLIGYCVYALWERMRDYRFVVEALLIFPIWLIDQKIKYYQTPSAS